MLTINQYLDRQSYYLEVYPVISWRVCINILNHIASILNDPRSILNHPANILNTPYCILNLSLPVPPMTTPIFPFDDPAYLNALLHDYLELMGEEPISSPNNTLLTEYGAEGMPQDQHGKDSIEE